MDNYRIRPGTYEDMESWLLLRRALWSDCPDVEHRLEMKQVLSSPGGVFVAENKDDGLIGFVEFSVRRDYVEGSTSSPVPYLEGWYVDEKYRTIGIGRELVEAVEEWSRQRGYKELGSDTRIDNTIGIKTHLATGFREVERGVHFIKSLG
jgi:aminoglycoside 6'-N-acetyltransferase I